MKANAKESAAFLAMQAVPTHGITQQEVEISAQSNKNSQSATSPLSGSPAPLPQALPSHRALSPRAGLTEQHRSCHSPPLSAGSVATAGPQSAHSLAAGWEVRHSKSKNRPFYVNRFSGETKWEHPGVVRKSTQILFTLLFAPRTPQQVKCIWAQRVRSSN